MVLRFGVGRSRDEANMIAHFIGGAFAGLLIIWCRLPGTSDVEAAIANLAIGAILGGIAAVGILS
jgi:hypothetical protein